MATRLDLAYGREVQKVRTSMVGLATSTWDGMGSWRDADYERTLTTLVPRIEAGQQRIANLTDSYIRKMALGTFGKVKDGPVLSASTEALRGVSAAMVYRRPFASMYAALSEGKPVPAAIAAGRERMLDLVLSGAQLSKTHAARAAIGRTRFTKFQRTLTGYENCAMCVIASTQRYHRGDLLPIHPGCDCGVKPFESEVDEQIINESLLESTHDLIASKLGDSDRGARLAGTGKFERAGISEYTDLIVTHEHGEMGPILTWRGDSFTGSRDIP